jgi:phage tail protein X
MLRLAEMLGRMFIPGRIAAADVAAAEAFPQMNPGIAHLQTLLAAGATGFNLPDFS